MITGSEPLGTTVAIQGLDALAVVPLLGNSPLKTGKEKLLLEIFFKTFRKEGFPGCS